MKFKDTDLSKKNRKMLLTINNPDKEGNFLNDDIVTTDMIQACINGNDQAKAAVIESLKNYIDNSSIIKGKTPVYYCFSLEVGEQGTPHFHIYFQFENSRCGNTIKGFFPKSHIDYCGGSNTSIRGYVFKSGKKWEGSEKEETRIDGTQYENSELPEEKGQGTRSDLDTIKELIDQGKTPREILEINPNNYFFEKYIGEMYYNKRCAETPIKRDVNVVVHTGVAGSGKTNVLTKLSEQDLFIGADYSSALFDNYEAQDTLFLDEFRGQIPYNQLLIILDGYKMPIHARYFNKFALWNNVHITSVIPLEQWYNNENIRDTFEQLKRRVTHITYHFITCGNVFIPNKMNFLKNHNKNDISYHEYTVESAKYSSYEELEKEALAANNVIAHYNDDMTISVSLDLERPQWLKERDAARHKWGKDKMDILYAESIFKPVVDNGDNDPFGMLSNVSNY